MPRFTTSLSDWESHVSSYGDVTANYGSILTKLGSGSITYPSGSVDSVGVNWNTWSGGYTGEVINVLGATSVTVNLNGLTAFGFQIEPDLYETESMTVTLSNGKTITEDIGGEAGAQFFGYYGYSVKSITITDNAGDDFAFGNFYYGAPSTPTYADESPSGATNYYDEQGGTILFDHTGGSLSWRNNNPGNILYVGQHSAIGSYHSPNGFTYCVFDTYADGVQAAVALLDTAKYNRLTLDQSLAKWVTGRPNAHAAYIVNYQNVVDTALGVAGTTPLRSLSNAQLQVLVVDGIQRAEGWKQGIVGTPSGFVPPVTASEQHAPNDRHAEKSQSNSNLLLSDIGNDSFSFGASTGAGTANRHASSTAFGMSHASFHEAHMAEADTTPNPLSDGATHGLESVHHLADLYALHALRSAQFGHHLSDFHLA